MLTISTHGGKCCGIKVIHGFESPYDWQPPRDSMAKMPPAYSLSRGIWEYCNPGKDFYFGKCEAEDTLQRLDRYLEYLAEMRPKGLVEVVLTYPQKQQWKKLLTERGFEEILTFQNSNSSGKNLYLFLLVTGKPKEPENVQD